MTQSQSLPAAARVYNSSAASAARRLNIARVTVTLADASTTKPWSYYQSAAGATSMQQQIGTAAAITANYANSVAPVSATLSNTSASYTTLGGQWQAAAVAGGETDYALFGFTVPAGTAAVPGRTLCITDVRIGETFVQGAAVGTTTVFVWGVAVSSTAVSLATADAATTIAPRRKMLGAQSLAATAAIGTLAPGFSYNMQTPLCAPAGTFVHTILRMPQGAATASLVFRGSVDLNGYWE